MLRSSTAMSGRNISIPSNAARPSVAVPTTVKAGSDPMSAPRPLRTMGWSSAMRTVLGKLEPPRQHKREPAAVAVDGEIVLTPEVGDPLLQRRGRCVTRNAGRARLLLLTVVGNHNLD